MSATVDSAVSYDFKILSTVPSNLRCSICGYLMRDAMQTECGHIYCNNCLTKIIEEKGPCAICPGEEDDCYEITKENVCCYLYLYSSLSLKTTKQYYPKCHLHYYLF